jgi:hypothetical protein
MFEIDDHQQLKIVRAQSLIAISMQAWVMLLGKRLLLPCQVAKNFACWCVFCAKLYFDFVLA